MAIAVLKKSKTVNLLKLTGKNLKDKVVKKIAPVQYESESVAYCYQTLEKVSRSFALVIKQLDPEMKDAICIFYLVLRALDTIEDDLNIPLEKRKELINDFTKKIGDTTFRLENVGDTPDYQELMRNYIHVAQVYKTLKPAYQRVIEEITLKMAHGMIHYAENDVETVKDYDLYCHYVAGLVGIGLSKLFVASGTENPILLEQLDIANSMGLFLQKTNITRDYAEDVEQGRHFWPSEIWSKYGNKQSDFYKKTDENSLNLLNEMVNNALQHFTDCIDYLSALKTPSVFRFCAIPQIMSLATLQEVYNNPLVFAQNVKISKGMSALLFNNCNNMQEFKTLANEILPKFQSSNHDTKILVEKIAQKLNL